MSKNINKRSVNAQQKYTRTCYRNYIKHYLNNMKVLILCTGNSCRSQMAQGFLESFDNSLIVKSAGTQASGLLNPKAVEVMKEIGLDISSHTSDSVEIYLNEEWDFVITVCGGADENCPSFTGTVRNRLHIGFDDPSDAVGSEAYIYTEFKRVRDEINERFLELYNNQIRKEL